MAQTYGIGIIPWSPLAGGFLSGKYQRDQARPAGTRFAQENEWTNRHFTDAAFAVVDAVQAIAGEKGCTPSQLALAWCAQQPGVTSPIIGPRTMEQLDDNLGAATVAITGEDRMTLDAVSMPGRAVVTYYNADWGPHQFR